ncbi:MAG: hypothetical protein PHC80_02540 [Eubacteriales bacterium]|nr:hypothetical protein [Eubacteriales bacterium]
MEQEQLPSMNMSARDALLEKLLESYSGYYDISREEGLDGLHKATAAFHSYVEKYVLVRSARMWAHHSHEYIFLFSLPHLDMTAWTRIRDYYLERGLSLVKPDKEHMYTYITAVLLCDEMDDDVAKEMKRFKYYKSFKLSFYGWTNARLTALEMNSGKIVSNYQGREMGRFVNKIYKEKTK